MRLVQLFLPLRDPAGQPFPTAAFARVRCELVERFGGVTAFQRSPAVGLWQDDEGEVQRDEVLLFEVFCEEPDRDWWRAYRAKLAERFEQDEILVLSLPVERL